jgi:hypothetical protein
VNEAHRLEELLGGAGEVRLGKREAHEVLQKLRARGGRTEAAERLESRLSEGDEIVLPRGEAQLVLDELRASGRRWISGSDAPVVVERAEPPAPEPEREPEPEPKLEPEPRRGWRFWRNR